MPMKTYHFSENPYPDAWGIDAETNRITLPNKNFDPVLGADLLNRYLDEWMMCDELGLNIWVNEHHSTATCMTVSCMLPLAILARQTKRARLLCLGAPVGVRHDPVQVAEELSYIDVLSRGRLDMGLVKGFPTEIAPTNINPAHITRRFAEASALVLKAMTTHDGPFNWEGEFFHFRQVNIWPRPYQQPHPPVWTPAFGVESARLAAERGYRLVSTHNAWAAREVFETYRQHARAVGKSNVSADNFAYFALIGVGRTEREGLERLDKICGYLRSSPHVQAQFSSPPGYVPVSARVASLKRGQTKGVKFDKGRDGAPIHVASASLDQLIEYGAAFAGTPDQVVAQIRSVHEYVGGFEHLLAMMQGGVLSHTDTADNLKLFAQEVLPRLQHLSPPNVEMEPLPGSHSERVVA